MPRLLALLLTLLTLAPHAAADGKVFSFAFPDQSQAQIPDQQALICYKNGYETLAIETRFQGKGTEFGWVVPFPSKPEITPATRGLFPTLNAVFQPRVRTTGRGLTLPLIFGAAGIAFLLYARNTVWRIAGFALILVMGTCITLPSLGSARGIGGDSTTLQFLDRRIVGDYDIATLASSDGAALTTWLSEQNFDCSPAAAAVIADYAKQGWVFAAIKLRREADSPEPTTPHPLVFTFKTENPIYPMRLTGADADRPLSLELFVFADERANAPGLNAISAAPAIRTDPVMHSRSRANSETIRISHTALSALIPAPPLGESLFATRLTGTLTPRQMHHDLPISWSAPTPTGRLVYSADAAAETAVEIALGILILCIILARLISPPTATRRALAVFAPFAAAAAAGLIAFATLPTVTLAPRSALRYSPAHALGEFLTHQNLTSLDHARTLAREAAPQLVERGIIPASDSPTTPTTPREEDSPGNYTFRTESDYPAFIWYDLTGQEHIIPLPIKPEDKK